MNTIDEQTAVNNNENLSKETLGVVSETITSTDFCEAVDILPSTEVKDILPALESLLTKEEEIKN